MFWQSLIFLIDIFYPKTLKFNQIFQYECFTATRCMMIFNRFTGERMHFVFFESTRYAF
jgi:hypothetical protein